MKIKATEQIAKECFMYLRGGVVTNEELAELVKEEEVLQADMGSHREAVLQVALQRWFVGKCPTRQEAFLAEETIIQAKSRRTEEEWELHVAIPGRCQVWIKEAQERMDAEARLAHEAQYTEAVKNELMTQEEMDAALTEDAKMPAPSKEDAAIRVDFVQLMKDGKSLYGAKFMRDMANKCACTVLACDEWCCDEDDCVDHGIEKAAVVGEGKEEEVVVVMKLPPSYPTMMTAVEHLLEVATTKPEFRQV